MQSVLEITGCTLEYSYLHNLHLIPATICFSDAHLISQLFNPTIAMSDSSRLRAAVLIISETAYNDPSTDKCVPALQDVFTRLGGDKWEIAQRKIVSDDVLMIQQSIMQDVDAGINLIITSGGTGFATKDVTPEVSPS